MAEVGKNIKIIRKEKNLTQDELAERLHCTRQTISNYENGKSEPNIELLVEIADVLEVEVGDLIYGFKEKENDKQQKFRAVAALTAAVGIQILVSVLTPAAKQYQWRNFEIAPFYVLRYVLRPFALILFGWGMAEAGRTFARISIWQGRTKKTIRIVRVLFYVLAAGLALLVILTLWTGADMVYMWYLSERAMRAQGAFDSSLVSHLIPDWLENLFLRVIMVYCANSFDIICLFWGAALGICRMKGEEPAKGT